MEKELPKNVDKDYILKEKWKLLDKFIEMLIFNSSYADTIYYPR